MFIDWYGRIIKELDHYMFLPETVRNKEIILSQYMLDNRKYKTEFKYGKRILFVFKLKKRAEIAEKNLNKRKMKIL